MSDGSELMHSSHKYIEKFKNAKGEWEYIYDTAKTAVKDATGYTAKEKAAQYNKQAANYRIAAANDESSANSARVETHSNLKSSVSSKKLANKEYEKSDKYSEKANSNTIGKIFGTNQYHSDVHSSNKAKKKADEYSSRSTEYKEEASASRESQMKYLRSAKNNTNQAARSQRIADMYTKKYEKSIASKIDKLSTKVSTAKSWLKDKLNIY
jgi:hypothetical protein